MPTPRSISNIKSNLLRPALTSHFEVQIGLPRESGQLTSILGPDQDKLNLMCSEATLPGSQLATLDINNDRTGVTEKHVYRRMFDDRIDLTFYVDAENYLPIKFFESWMRTIVDEDNEAEDKGIDSLDPTYFYRVRYPDDYMATGLKVIKFERDYKSTLEYEFVRSFPLSISSMPVSYDSSSLLKCTVSMSYIRYVAKEVFSAKTSQPQTPIQQAQNNGSALTTGGIPGEVAKKSGSSVTTISTADRLPGGRVYEANKLRTSLISSGVSEAEAEQTARNAFFN